MKKVLIILLTALMVLSMAACGSSGKQDDSKASEPAKAATPEEIEAAVADALGDGYLCTETISEDGLWGCPLGNLDMDKVKSYVAKEAAVKAVNVDTVVVAEVEEGYADEAVDAFNESCAQTVSYIRQYPFGVPKVEGARIFKVGNTVMLILAGASADQDATAEDEAKLAAAEYEKVDNALKDLFGSLPENLAVVPEAGEGKGGGLIGG